ncbi:MAG: extracellular solute-binding protein [Treponemataceae bacterium]|nr:extracellular solute-binding protein [Treponemataceae bacterium]
MKKFLVVLCALMCIAGVMFAGGRKEAPKAADVMDLSGAAGIEGWKPFEKNVTITVPVYDRGKAGYPAVDDNYWTQWIQKNFGDKYNVTVKYVAIPRGDVMTKYSMLIAAQDTPTILMEYDYPKVTQWANDGAMQVIDLNEFKHVAPTYYQSMVDHNQLGYTDVNGETYFILSERPFYDTPYTYVTFVRMDWLRKVGYDHVPANYEEYTDAMDKIIAAGLTDIAPVNFNLPSAAYIANFAFRDFPANEEEWVMHSSLGTPCFAWEPTARMLKKYNEEYHKGYYSKEFDLDLASTAGSQAETDFINGKLYSFGGYMSANVQWLNAFYANNPDAELALADGYTGIDGVYQKTAALRADNPFGMIVGFSSLASKEQLKAAYMLMEWMIQPENLFVLENGEEGVNFNYNADGIAVQVNLENTGNVKMMNHNSNIDMTCLVRASKKVGETIEDAIAAISPRGLPQDFTQALIDNYYQQKEIAAKGWAYSDPIFAVSIEAESEYNASLLRLYQEDFAKLVKCDPAEFDALYAKLAKEYLAAGYQEIIDERLAAYKAGNTTKLPANVKK